MTFEGQEPAEESQKHLKTTGDALHVRFFNQFLILMAYIFFYSSFCCILRLILFVGQTCITWRISTLICLTFTLIWIPCNILLLLLQVMLHTVCLRIYISFLLFIIPYTTTKDIMDTWHWCEKAVEGREVPPSDFIGDMLAFGDSYAEQLHDLLSFLNVCPILLFFVFTTNPISDKAHWESFSQAPPP